MSSSLEKLKNAQTIDDLAAMLGFKPSALTFIVYKLPAEQKYRTFDIPNAVAALARSMRQNLG